MSSGNARKNVLPEGIDAVQGFPLGAVKERQSGRVVITNKTAARTNLTALFNLGFYASAYLELRDLFGEVVNSKSLLPDNCPQIFLRPDLLEMLPHCLPRLDALPAGSVPPVRPCHLGGQGVRRWGRK